MPKIVLIAHDVRSCHNVGSLLRTADGLGIHKVFLTGYTPYPSVAGDTRLPHLANKIDRQINKTALGAQESVDWRREQDIFELFKTLNSDGYSLVALEQSPKSIPLDKFQPTQKLALIVGNELGGIIFRNGKFSTGGFHDFFPI